jgi:hypothetical protein
MNQLATRVAAPDGPGQARRVQPAHGHRERVDGRWKIADVQSR